MTHNIVIRPKAEDDLVQIWVHIAKDNPAAADRVFLAAEKTFQNIAFMPGMGTPYKSKRSGLKGIRFHPVQNYPVYLIYYRKIESGIEIVRVLHGHMDRPQHLEPDD